MIIYRTLLCWGAFFMSRLGKTLKANWYIADELKTVVDRPKTGIIKGVV